MIPDEFHGDIDIDEEEMQTQVILGRLLLATSGALIDVLEGTVTSRVRDDKVTLDVLACNNPSPKHPLIENPSESPP